MKPLFLLFLLIDRFLFFFVLVVVTGAVHKVRWRWTPHQRGGCQITSCFQWQQLSFSFLLVFVRLRSSVASCSSGKYRNVTFLFTRPAQLLMITISIMVTLLVAALELRVMKLQNRETRQFDPSSAFNNYYVLLLVLLLLYACNHHPRGNQTEYLTLTINAVVLPSKSTSYRLPRPTTLVMMKEDGEETRSPTTRPSVSFFPSAKCHNHATNHTVLHTHTRHQNLTWFVFFSDYSFHS